MREFVAATGGEYAGGPAPPTFPIVLAFDAMNAFLEAEQIDLFRIVHGEQKFAYERPVRPGDVLTATLTVASLRQIAGNDIIGTTSEITDADRRAGLLDVRDPGPPGGGRMTPDHADLTSPAPTWSRTPGPAATTTRSTRTRQVAQQRRAARA